MFALVRVTVSPPAGAAKFSRTVAVDLLPPVTEVGLRVRVEIESGATVIVAVLLLDP